MNKTLKEAVKSIKEISQKIESNEQIKEIVDKYGELGKDGDTIKTEHGDISLKDILEGNNEIPEDQKKKIAELEQTIQQLEGTIENLNSQLPQTRN